MTRSDEPIRPMTFEPPPRADWIPAPSAENDQSPGAGLPFTEEAQIGARGCYAVALELWNAEKWLGEVEAPRRGRKKGALPEQGPVAW